MDAELRALRHDLEVEIGHADLIEAWCAALRAGQPTRPPLPDPREHERSVGYREGAMQPALGLFGPLPTRTTRRRRKEATG
jgi:hypothetical protein